MIDKTHKDQHALLHPTFTMVAKSSSVMIISAAYFDTLVPAMPMATLSTMHAIDGLVKEN